MTANPLSTVRAKLGAFAIAWVVVWAALVVFLWAYWFDLPEIGVEPQLIAGL